LIGAAKFAPRGCDVLSGGPRSVSRAKMVKIQLNNVLGMTAGCTLRFLLGTIPQQKKQKKISNQIHGLAACK
jgi:hypothetical protein